MRIVLAAIQAALVGVALWMGNTVFSGGVLPDVAVQCNSTWSVAYPVQQIEPIALGAAVVLAIVFTLAALKNAGRLSGITCVRVFFLDALAALLSVSLAFVMTEGDAAYVFPLMLLALAFVLQVLSAGSSLLRNIR